MAGILEAIGISLLVSGISAGITYALTPDQKVSQGRLNDLTSANSSYGTVIPWAWGTVRLQGTRIWQDFLEEEKKTSTQGGGFLGLGPKLKTTNYIYYGYYAEMFCECPFRPIVEYQRYWQNKKLTYSKVGGAETIAEGGKFAEQYLRFYRGEPATNPDPLLTFTEPISNYSYGIPTDPDERDAFLQSQGIDPLTANLTTAYNYRAYIVAQRIPLGDFFNAIPKGEAEIKASENCTLGQIIGDLMGLYYQSDRYDTSLIDTMPVRGFAIDTIAAAKQAISTLQQAYFFDVAYTNGVYKFIPLNHPRDVVNLSRKDLGAHIKGASQNLLEFEIIEKDRTQLPSKVTVKYIDPDLNYDDNSQSSNFEVKTYYNPNPVTLTLNLVLTASEAATIADRAFILAWSQSDTYKWQLPPAFLNLEPTDLIPDLFTDSEYPIKITQTRIGANLIMSCEGVIHDNYFWNFIRVLEEGGVTVGVADYDVVIEVEGTPNTVTDTAGTVYTQGTDYTIDENNNINVLSTGGISQGTELVISTTVEPAQNEADLGTIVPVGDTELKILDIPLIDNDDADYTLYFTGDGGDNWSGAALYFSTDDSQFIFAADIDSYGIFGEVVNYSTSNGSPIIEVQVNRSELEPTTLGGITSGSYYALVGSKIYSFEFAELIEPDVYALTNLTGGLRGTELEPDPVVGDRFVLLTGEAAEITKIVFTAQDIEQTLYFKAVSNGQTLDEVESTQIYFRGIAQRPYAPVNIEATKNREGDITINWDRRDRHSDIENPPILSEDVELYQLKVVLDDESEVVRTINPNNSSAIYNVQNQTADFGAIQSTITVKIAQVSSSYGNGTFATATLIPELLIPAPTITSFSPTSGQVGQTISVTGTDLDLITAVKIGDIEQINPVSTDSTSISFNIGHGSVSGSIEVTTAGGSATSTDALIIEIPQTASGFPRSKKEITLPYTIDVEDFNMELITTESTGTISIPDTESGFIDYWGCWISLDGSGSVTIERVGGGNTGIKQSVALGEDDTVKLWHRGNNTWKVD